MKTHREEEQSAVLKLIHLLSKDAPDNTTRESTDDPTPHPDIAEPNEPSPRPTDGHQ